MDFLNTGARPKWVFICLLIEPFETTEHNELLLIILLWWRPPTLLTKVF